MHNIYILTNTINHKVYIGQTNNPKKRWARHKFPGKSPYMLISKAILKYGADKFTFEILVPNIETLEKANEIEIKLIKLFQSDNVNIGYNRSPGGSFLSAETRRKIGIANKGKKLSPEQLAKRSLTWFKQGHRICLGRKASDETKIKLSESHKGYLQSEKSRAKRSDSLKLLYKNNPRPKRPGSTSSFIGVHKTKSGWASTKTVNGKRLWLGTFKTEEEAYKARLSYKAEL